MVKRKSNTIKHLPDEIWLKISDILVKDRQLRAMANLHKALNWNIDISIFQNELIHYRFYSDDKRYYIKNYNESMIELWGRAGIDDGVPETYLKSNLKKGCALFRTMWARIICHGKFYDVIKYYSNLHNKCVKYSNNIIIDDRKYNKYYKYKKQLKDWNPCEKCMNKYIKDISFEKMKIGKDNDSYWITVPNV